jgi:hypothetical protein
VVELEIKGTKSWKIKGTKMDANVKIFYGFAKMISSDKIYF